MRTRNPQIVAGVIYGIAAWQALGRVPNADPNAFQLGNLDSITAVVIGGTSLFGGKASVIGALVGSLLIGLINNGLILMGLEFSQQQIVRGVIIILAVALVSRRG